MHVEWECPNCGAEFISDVVELENFFQECEKCDAVYDVLLEVSIHSVTQVEELH